MLRKPRSAEADWPSCRSWVAGDPDLGNQPWPQGATPAAPIFLAQIDLAELAQALPGGAVWPKDGALCVFASGAGDDGQVVFVPREELTGKTTSAPNGQTPEALGIDEIPGIANPARWPVGFHHPASGLPDSYAPRKYNISLSSLESESGETMPTFWLHTQILLPQETERLKSQRAVAEAAVKQATAALDKFTAQHEAARAAQPKTLVSRLIATLTRGAPLLPPAQQTAEHRALSDKVADAQKRLADLASRIAGLEDQITEVHARYQGKDPWTAMTPGETAEIEALVAGWHDLLPETKYDGTPKPAPQLSSVSTEVLKRALVGPERAYTLIPQVLRDAVNARFLLPIDGPNILFGAPRSPQGHWGADDAPDHLLLQIESDDLLNWGLGGGVLHFWLTKAQIAEGAWDQAHMSFDN